jgi:hypothetical protein
MESSFGQLPTPMSSHLFHDVDALGRVAKLVSTVAFFPTTDAISRPQPTPDIRPPVTCKTRPLTREINFCVPGVHLCRWTRKFTITCHLQGTLPKIVPIHFALGNFTVHVIFREL